jgi:hypothetical protein
MVNVEYRSKEDIPQEILESHLSEALYRGFDKGDLIPDGSEVRVDYFEVQIIRPEV